MPRCLPPWAPRDRSHVSEAFVWVTSLIELGKPDIANGVLVNHTGFTKDCTYRDALPDQGGLAGSEAHWLDEPDDEPSPAHPHVARPARPCVLRRRVVAVSVPIVPFPAASIPPGGRSAADRLRQGSWFWR